MVVDTREHAATLNAAIRDRLVAAGAVDDRRVAVTRDGQRLGAGDVIVTRRNDHDLGVANRETWTVTRVHRDGRLTVDDSGRGGRELPADYVRGHVELGYAVTGYGAQGDTTTEAHLVLTETTTAAAGYVAMTRGRASNTAHLVAADLDDAREQWIAAFGRDRADLGPAAAGQSGRPRGGRLPHASRPAGRRCSPNCAARGPNSSPRTGSSNACRNGLSTSRHRPPGRHTASRSWPRSRPRATPPGTALERADQAATGCAAILTERAEQHAARLLRQTWDAQLPAAEHAARTIAAGPGRLGIHRGRVRDAQQHLDTWTATWSPVFAGSDLDPRQIAARPIVFASHVQRVTDALDEHARRLAAADHPDQAARLHAAQQARERYDAAAAAYHQTRRQPPAALAPARLPTPAPPASSPSSPSGSQDAQHRVPIRRPADPAAHHTTRRSPATPTREALLQHARTGWATEQAPPTSRRRPDRPARPDRSGTTRPRSTHIDHGPSLGR